MPMVLLRSLIALFGICAIAWAITALRIYTRDAPFAETAKAALSGEKFGARRLALIKSQLDARQADLVEASARDGAAILRMILVEGQLRDGKGEISYADYDQLRASIREAIARSPTNSFMWLAAFWQQRLRGEATEKDWDLLRMSYWAAPREAWIAVKRNPLTLALPEATGDQFLGLALSEFTGLVRSGLYWEAAGIFEAVPTARKLLLNRMMTVDVGDRRAFARALKSKDIEDVVIPGVD